MPIFLVYWLNFAKVELSLLHQANVHHKHILYKIIYDNEESSDIFVKLHEQMILGQVP